MSWNMVEWLDRNNYAYDVYSDDDLTAGRIDAADYEVLLPHGHQEYWTDLAIGELKRFLADGGNVLALAANMMPWKTVKAGDGVLEVRKFGRADPGTIIGPGDVHSGVSGTLMGPHRLLSACRGNVDYTTLGTVNHIIGVCSLSERPGCFGDWVLDDDSHWLTSGLGTAGTEFGFDGAGHETDMWEPGLMIPDLIPGTAVVLAHGTNFGGSSPALAVSSLTAPVPCRVAASRLCRGTSRLVGSQDRGK